MKLRRASDHTYPSLLESLELERPFYPFPAVYQRPFPAKLS